VQPPALATGVSITSVGYSPEYTFPEMDVKAAAESPTGGLSVTENVPTIALLAEAPPVAAGAPPLPVGTPPLLAGGPPVWPPVVLSEEASSDEHPKLTLRPRAPAIRTS
jgi:hypothetical protein